MNLSLKKFLLSKQRKVSVKSYLLNSPSVHPLWWAGMLFPPKKAEVHDEVIVT